MPSLRLLSLYLGCVACILFGLNALASADDAFYFPDELGPYQIGYDVLLFVDRDVDSRPRPPAADMGERVLLTRVWFPVDDADTEGAVPVVYDSLTGLLIPAGEQRHAAARSVYGALVGPGSVLPDSFNPDANCLEEPENCVSSLLWEAPNEVIQPLPVSSDRPFPLILSAHGGFGTNFVTAEEMWASHGFVVVAPQMPGDRLADTIVGFCSEGQERPCQDDDPIPHLNAPIDLSFVLTQMLDKNLDPEDRYYGTIRPDRIGVMGFSNGSSAPYSLAGGQVGNPGAYDPRITAIVSGGGAPGPDSVFLGAIEIPVLQLVPSEDGAGNWRNMRRAFDELTGSVARYRVEFQGARHSGMAGLCGSFQDRFDMDRADNSTPADDSSIFLLMANLFFTDADSICPPELFYDEANYGVLEEVLGSLLRYLLLPADLIPGYIDDLGTYIPTLVESEARRLANLYMVAFFRAYLLDELGYEHFLRPSYAQAQELDAEVEACELRPSGRSTCWGRKVIICHNERVEVTVEGPEVDAHLAHGDIFGLCPTHDVFLHDNGPLVTCAGCGAGGADESVLQLALGGVLGFGHQVSADVRIADDFTVTHPSGWQIDTITFYAYQTASSTNSTITAVNLQIWDGPPNDSESRVVWGDTVTNVLTDTTWSNIYRVTDTASGDTLRPIMANTVTVNITLPGGTYWLDWQADGSLPSGPWAPPITLPDQAATGNALQFFGGAWASVVDFGAPKGFPFVIAGSRL